MGTMVLQIYTNGVLKVAYEKPYNVIKVVPKRNTVLYIKQS